MTNTKISNQNHRKNRILVVGLGLIGGSLAWALRLSGLARLTGYDTDFDVAQKAQQTGVIDQIADDLPSAVTNADIVILAVPVKAIEQVIKLIAPYLCSHTVLTDVGSVKGNVITAARQVFGQLPSGFVPGHPIAGSEHSGIEAANAKLFIDHKVILTPVAESDPQAVVQLTLLWQAVGAEVLTMPADRHDEVLAATSHLPHLLAFSLVDTLANDADNQDIFRYAAGGFRDFTRVAGSDPIMWRDVFLANQKASLKMLDKFTDGLDSLRQAILVGDSTAVLGVFTRAQVARHHFEKILAGTAYTSTTTQQIHFQLQPGGQVKGRIRVPGDKSISHRSIILGSLADGITHISGFLEGEDALATLQAFRDMGVVIEGPVHGRVTVHGVGLHGLTAPPGSLYMGNSGTTIRLLSGLMAGQNFAVELSGDTSLSQRPMERVAQPLRLMGAKVETASSGCPPLRIQGNQTLQGIDYKLPMASAQVKSCILLAGLYAEGTTRVTEPAPTRDHTERMLHCFGYPIERQGSCCILHGQGRLSAVDIDVPADISSAAFFLVAAAICPDSDLILEHVGMNATRTGVVNILQAMGANLVIKNLRQIGSEPVADLHIRYSPLKGIDVPQQQVPLAIDEFPALFIAAACAQGTTRVTGAEELQVKESNRIKAMVDGLQVLGVNIKGTADGAIIAGGGETSGAIFSGGDIITYNDHRIAMAFSIAALRAHAPIRVLDCAHVATSFPNFVELACQVGIQLEVETYS